MKILYCYQIVMTHANCEWNKELHSFMSFFVEYIMFQNRQKETCILFHVELKCDQQGLDNCF